jgi:hypothetical protein
MCVVELRLLLALVLVLLGATVIVGLNFEDDDDTIALPGQTQTLRANSEEEIRSSVEIPSSALRPSRTDSEIAPRPRASVIDVVVLRC